MTGQLETRLAERDASRDRFRTSLAEAKARLAPAALAREAASSARSRLESAAGNVADTARKHPIAIAAGLTAIAALLLRKPILGAISRLTKEK